MLPLGAVSTENPPSSDSAAALTVPGVELKIFHQNKMDEKIEGEWQTTFSFSELFSQCDFQRDLLT